MTTIIVDNQERKVYTDSRASVANKKETKVYSDKFIKVFYNSKNKIIVGTGSVKEIKKYVESVNKGKSLPKLKNSRVIECIRFPTYKLKVHDETGIATIDTGKRFVTFGSGADIALGNLFSTNNPVEAIEAASTFDYSTGGSIVEYDLSDRLYDEDTH